MSEQDTEYILDFLQRVGLAMKSGEYRKIEGRLRMVMNVEKSAFCAIGVAIDQAIKADPYIDIYWMSRGGWQSKSDPNRSSNTSIGTLVVEGNQVLRRGHPTLSPISHTWIVGDSVVDRIRSVWKDLSLMDMYLRRPREGELKHITEPVWLLGHSIDMINDRGPEITFDLLGDILLDHVRLTRIELGNEVTEERMADFVNGLVTEEEPAAVPA